MKIVIVGAGGHGQVVADMIKAGATVSGRTLEVAGFLDDDPCLAGSVVGGLPVLGGLASLDRVGADAVVVAIGSNVTRERISHAVRTAGHRIVTIVHPHASIGGDVAIGDGSMVSAGAVIVAAAHIGPGAILNTGCTVDHHCRIGEFAHIAPGVNLGGEVWLGARALVGIGAVVLPRCRVGTGATVGAGAVVIGDVPDGVTVVGVPARPLAPAPSAKDARLLVN